MKKKSENNLFRKSELLKGLDLQIQELQNKKNLQKHDKQINSKAFVDTYNPYYTEFCSHKQIMSVCSYCNRKYPLNYLTKRSKSIGQTARKN